MRLKYTNILLLSIPTFQTFFFASLDFSFSPILSTCQQIPAEKMWQFGKYFYYKEALQPCHQVTKFSWVEVLIPAGQTTGVKSDSVTSRTNSSLDVYHKIVFNRILLTTSFKVKYSRDQSCRFKGPHKIHLASLIIIKACEDRMDPMEDIVEKKISPPCSG